LRYAGETVRPALQLLGEEQYLALEGRVRVDPAQTLEISFSALGIPLAQAPLVLARGR
jgi:hypothetical protein